MQKVVFNNCGMEGVPSFTKRILFFDIIILIILSVSHKKISFFDIIMIIITPPFVPQNEFHYYCIQLITKWREY